jgi:predicted nucleotidyltransferase
VTQSMISAYESGHRQPALPTLTRLIEAAGLHLRVSLDEVRPEPLSGPVGQIVRQRSRELVAAAEVHGASHLRVFGSVARGEDVTDSDVDLLVDLPAGLGLLGYGRLVDELERVLDGPTVDLVPAADLKPEVRARVERDAVPL